MTSVIPIDSSSVQCVLIEGVQHLCIRDLIMAVCKKDYNQAGELWKKAKADLEAYCAHYKFPGRAEQPVIQVQGAVKLLAALPCDERVRAQANETLARHSDNVVESERLKIDILRRTADIQAKALEERLKIENEALKKEMELKAIINCALMLNKKPDIVKLGKVVTDMGIDSLTSADLQRVGSIASAKFRAAYGSQPQKRAYKDKTGKEMWINEYSEEHIPILQEAVREHMEQEKNKQQYFI
jgi:hypothetical protein